jgi:nitrate reductase molybdenum cofactor assembly chaperone
VTTAQWERLADGLEYPEGAPSDRQEEYVRAFDLDPACTLDIGWHLFGESPERGRFLAVLREAIGRAGVPDRGELPDYLPTLLRLIAREQPEIGCELADMIAPAVSAMRDRLQTRQNGFAEALDAVVAALARVRPQEVQP